MADQGGGGIAWTEETWNPVRGCTRVSEGCRNCYAERVAARFAGPGLPYEGLARNTQGGARWTGVVRVVEEHLNDPLRWQRPRRIFVNSMSDLFHERLSDRDVLRVFNVMREAHYRGHTFQVLTKRAARMRQFCSQLNFDSSGEGRLFLEDRGLNRQGKPISFMPSMKDVWLGVSVEDQAAADERIPELLATPAAVRWLSVEPQIGPVDLSRWLLPDPPRWESQIDWVVIGGESGPGARPFDAQWARDLVRQCKRAGVPAFVKQMGAYVVDRNDAGFHGDDDGGWHSAVEYGGEIRVEDLDTGYQGAPVRVHLRNRKGGDPAEWPAELRVREYPEARS